MITDSASITNTPPTIGEQQLLLDQQRDGAERAAERERSDVAHEDFRRDTQLYQRKPRLAPTSAPQKIVSSDAPAGTRTSCR